MAQSSSASATASTAPDSDYDVFISHRGPDVKKTFASHLYRSLQSQHGLRVFLDQPELQRGEYLIPQIEAAIRSASVHVAIFSKGYAESTWCLQELVSMLESNFPVIPVFYNVKPGELRWTRGTKGGYAKALAGLEKKRTADPETGEKKLRYEPSLIKKWRNALSQAAGISGFELEACNGQYRSRALWESGSNMTRIDLPTDFSCPNLLYLNLHYNESLREVPDGFLVNLTSLRVLDLSGTKIESLPMSLWHLTQLQYLDLSETLIKDVPEDICSLSQLQFLYLNSCKNLESLPPKIRELENLNLHH